MSKILRNVSGSPVNINDTGVSIPIGFNYTIPPQDYLLWAASSDVVTEVGNGSLIVNDGSFDLNISDGIDLIKGLFPTSVTIAPSTLEAEFAEISSVGSSTPSNIITYIATGGERLLRADVSGTNIAVYELSINNIAKDRLYTNFGAQLNGAFEFQSGLSLVAGDSVKVQVTHFRNYVGDFNAKLLLQN